MDTKRIKEIEQYCLSLAKKANEIILEVYEDASLYSQVEEKQDNTPVTLADTRANALIVAALGQEYPEFAVLSEEERDNLSRRENPYCFIVDPLDGTKEFVKRNGQFTVNIALAHLGKVIMGVITVPVTGESYFASQGCGSFYEDAQGNIYQNQVSSRVGWDQPDKIRLVMSASHGSPKMDALIQRYQITQFVKMGSSLKGCLVARGEAEVYYRHGLTSEWDTAAMQCIVEEAGGLFRQMDGSPMVYNRENTRNELGFYLVNRAENVLE